MCLPLQRQCWHKDNAGTDVHYNGHVRCLVSYMQVSGNQRSGLLGIRSQPTLLLVLLFSQAGK